MTLPPLHQQGRASLEFLGSLSGYSGRVLLNRARTQVEQRVSADDVSPVLRERVKTVAEALSDSKEYAFDRLITRYVAEKKEERAFDALAPIQADVEALLVADEGRGGSLTLDPTLRPPRYYAETEFHLTPGGWNGHPLMGALLHELVYPYILNPGGVGAVTTGENVYDQRFEAARHARRSDYSRIVEFGVGTGQYAAALQRAFPSAHIIGIDLAEPLLRWARHVAVERGYTWELRQAAAESTGLPDASVNLATAYILFHEIPPRAAAAVTREMFRVLEPGGDVLIADVAPYSRQEPFQTLILDWETENRNEPFWRQALLTDRAALLRDAGFTDVEEFAVGPGNYPWITRGTKPAR